MDGLKRRMEGRGEGTHELGDRKINITQSEIQRENRLNENEPSLRDLWDKRYNICHWSPGRRERVRLTKHKQK